MNTDSIEIYREERAEARACGDLDFPVYSEWLQNQRDPHAERIRAEERIEMKEEWAFKQSVVEILSKLPDESLDKLRDILKGS